MIEKASCAIFALTIFMGDMSSGITSRDVRQAPGISPDAQYLGPKPTKAYFFPWLVSFLRNTPSSKELFGSGSILTNKWVIGSMDCFVRPVKKGSTNVPLYTEIENWEVQSGGIWGNPLERGLAPGSPWSQVRQVAEVHMFSNPPGTAGADLRTLTFSANSIPQITELNGILKSPFGFSMSVALIKVKKVPGSGGSDEWEWKRSTLPIPLFSHRAQLTKNILDHEVDYLEEHPFAWRCHVAGWRTGDWRLVEYEVVYVPIDQCQSIFCSYDDRACSEWPVKNIHLCFKSLTYADPCWRDQGSALYCKQIAETVVGILTSAPTCGYDGLPGVFTLVHHGLDLLGRVSSEAYRPIPEADRSRYTPPPEKDLIPAY